MKLRDFIFSARCDNCHEPLINQKVYTARGNITSGLCSAFSSDEPVLYDAVDCPRCGRQRILGKQYYKVVRNE